MTIKVRLDWDEMIIGAMVGVTRQVENLRSTKKDAKGVVIERNHRHGISNEEAPGWQQNIEGALGEKALAKATNRYWGKGDHGDDDVGTDHVRTTRLHTNQLILHPDDKDDKRYYLVTGQNGDYQIHGWILGRDGKKDEYWAEKVKGRAAFFVPQSVLTPMEEAE